MEKRDIIAQLRKAKSAHIRWRSYAQALSAGVPMDESKVPVIHTDCDFGRWYFGDGQALSTIPGYREIDTPHEQLHNIYMEIFKHLFEEENVGLFSRLLGKKAKTPERRRAAVQSLLDELLKISEKLLFQLETLESRISAMGDAELEKLY